MLIEMNAQIPPQDSLGNTFAALADPTRRAILARLRLGEAPVTVLAEPFDISLPAISRHLKVLERAGLIARSRDAKWRPCRLDAAPIQEVASWADGYRQFWETRFAKLDDLLVELQGEESKRDGDK
jgi:DNA-binding transcriptional ArsR family regulator